jgi:hypothetical protein
MLRYPHRRDLKNESIYGEKSGECESEENAGRSAQRIATMAERQ